MENTLKHTVGEKAKVEVWNYKKKASDFFECEITGITGAVDRDYRVNVILPNGTEYSQCAPECVLMQ